LNGKDLIGKIISYLTHPNLPDYIKTFDDYNSKIFNHSDVKWKIVKFADKLKDIVCILIGCTREQLEDETFKNTELEEEWNSVFNYKKNFYTPRKLLQIIGTDLLRNQLHPQVWVNATMAEYDKHLDYLQNTKDSVVSALPNWIITDCRFPNECEAIKKRDGILIRVNRPSTESDDKHPSEVALDDYKDFDYIIQNDNSIEDLIQKVKDILVKENII
jgi:hypothetical protein